MKNILITGASRGVGYAVAMKFLEENHTVFCTSTDINKLNKLAKIYPNKCKPLELDLSNEKSIAAFAQKLVEMQEEIDIVIQNSGAIVNKPFHQIGKEELEYTYAVNVLGPFQLTQKLLSCLSLKAHVVMISSMGGFQGTQKFPGLTAYSSSKAAIASLTECLQEEFKGTEWAFNCLCLGAVQTEMLENAFPGYAAPLVPEQIARYIFTFATQQNLYFKGKILPVSVSTP